MSDVQKTQASDNFIRKINKLVGPVYVGPIACPISAVFKAGFAVFSDWKVPESASLAELFQTTRRRGTILRPASQLFFRAAGQAGP